MKEMTKSFLIICLAVSAIWVLEGAFRPVQAAIGSSCTTSSGCSPQPSTCHKNLCTGPCTSNAACQGASFLNAMGWENGVCAGDSADPGVCVEAPLDAIPTGPQTGVALLHLVETVTDWVFAGFLVLAVIFIILASLQFLTGRGEPAQISQARMKLMWAAIAIVIAAMAKGIPTVVRAIMGV